MGLRSQPVTHSSFSDHYSGSLYHGSYSSGIIKFQDLPRDLFPDLFHVLRSRSWLQNIVKTIKEKGQFSFTISKNIYFFSNFPFLFTTRTHSGQDFHDPCEPCVSYLCWLDRFLCLLITSATTSCTHYL